MKKCTRSSNWTSGSKPAGNSHCARRRLKVRQQLARTHTHGDVGEDGEGGAAGVAPGANPERACRGGEAFGEGGGVVRRLAGRRARRGVGDIPCRQIWARPTLPLLQVTNH